MAAHRFIRFARSLCGIVHRQWLSPRKSPLGNVYIRHRGMTLAGAVKLAWETSRYGWISGVYLK